MKDTSAIVWKAESIDAYIRIHGELVLITKDTIKKTNNWFARNCIGCIREAQSGEVFVNDVKGYTEWRLEQLREYRSNDFEKGLWYWQKAYYIQSGTSVPLLS